MLMENKSLNLKSTIKMLTFQLNFVWEVFLIDLVLLSPEKYLWMEIYMIFQSVTILLTNMAYQTFTSLYWLKRKENNVHSY